jgi:hypothetical protein
VGQPDERAEPIAGQVTLKFEKLNKINVYNGSFTLAKFVKQKHQQP